MKARLAIAPRAAYVLSQTPEALAWQAALCEPRVTGSAVRAAVAPDGPAHWRIELVAVDRIGLLSRAASALNELGFDIADAVVCTWPDGSALTSFGVRRAPSLLLPMRSSSELALALARELSTEPIEDAGLAWNDAASPWHTLCSVVATDRPGLLHAITSAFAAAGASVHSAKISTRDGVVDDTFELTDLTGGKLGDDVKEQVASLLRSGVRARRARRFGAARAAR